MSLDEQLRAALDQEADVRDVPPPDIGGLISGGRARRRRRTTARLAVAVAAVLVLAGGAYGATRVDSGDPPSDPGISEQPSRSSTFPGLYPENQRRIEPGTYRKFVAWDSSFSSIEVELTFEDKGWRAFGQPVVLSEESGSAAGVAVLQPRELAAGSSGCDSQWEVEHPADTAQALGRQLAQLPSSTVVQPLTPTEAFGREALHLRLRIDVACGPDDFYRFAEAHRDLGLTWTEDAQEVVIDLWVLTFGGTAVVVASWHETDATSQHVDQAARVRDSITFLHGE